MSSHPRVCDVCALRRVKCDGQDPCSRCLAASLDCTRIRIKAKPGPKGIHKKTLEKVKASRRGLGHNVSTSLPEWQGSFPLAMSNDVLLSTFDAETVLTQRNIVHAPGALSSSPPETSPHERDSLSAVNGSPCTYEDTTAYDLYNVDTPEHRALAVAPPREWPYRVPISTLEPYLEIYHHKLFPVWPIVNKDVVVAKLNADPADAHAYMLASSVCAATILQLQLAVAGMDCSILEPRSMLREVEDLRRMHDYRDNPTLDDLSIGFFMHITYLHVGKRTTSTLLLREAISLAHMLDLHRPQTYRELTHDEGQERLRKLWLLFITERAHATQYDLPCIVNIDPSIPVPDDTLQPSNLSAFTLLCKMFAFYYEASSARRHTAQSLMLLHNQLQQVPALARGYNELQEADLRVTQQWMRLMFWKLAVSQIPMTADPSDNIGSMLFPVRIAKDLLSNLSAFSITTLEAHGPGMELKLFEFVNAVADVVVCVPPRVQRTFELGPHDFLLHLAGVLKSFRGGNNALLPILQTRLADVGLDVPAVPRIIDVTRETSDSHASGSLTWSDESVREVEELNLLLN